VVDNNSTDRTASIAAAAGATVVFEAERGVCQARQRGTEAARGEIIVSTDADTRFTPGWLSGIDWAFHHHPGAVAVAGPCRFTAAPWWGNLYSTVLFRAGGPAQEGHRAGGVRLGDQHRVPEERVVRLRPPTHPGRG
jgi:glycosyltransferase involved in cell wall biosynthesis